MESFWLRQKKGILRGRVKAKPLPFPLGDGGAAQRLQSIALWRLTKNASQAFLPC